MLIVAVIALRFAGLGSQELAVGGALTAVFVGLAAQQTLGNVIAETVLACAQPFRVGDRVRLQGGDLAGTVEGTVSSLGLLYTVLASGEDAIMIPNSLVMNVAVVPLREPTAVDIRARLRAGVTPIEVERVLRERISTPIRGSPRVMLEELYADELVVRAATPMQPSDGRNLASEVLEAIAPYTRASLGQPARGRMAMTAADGLSGIVARLSVGTHHHEICANGYEWSWVGQFAHSIARGSR
jgi:small-conductance mechanosensitive channel